jgi:ferredoxin
LFSVCGAIISGGDTMSIAPEGPQANQGTPNPRRPKRGSYKPKAETLALLQVSGNPINGLSEMTTRRPSPFFWHPPDQHPFGALQIAARLSSRKCPGSPEAFQAAYNYPELVAVSSASNEAPAGQLAEQATAFALAHEADAVGIAPMDPLYVFEGYTIDEPWVIVLALAHNYERLKDVPSDETNGIGVVDVGDQYGVTTDMPLVATTPYRFGADEFCKTCQVCTNSCLPGAISENTQLVRGVERWYVDFDKCIPFFVEAASCGICIAECPWTRPSVRPKLLATMTRRMSQTPCER